MLNANKKKDRQSRIIKPLLHPPAALRIFGLAMLLALFCGCSTPKYTEYHGADIFQGKGGSMHTVDDIDFWSSGDPMRKYKILGMVEGGSRHRSPFGRLGRMFSSPSDHYSAIAEIARKQGGDAVLLVSEDAEESFFDDEDSGQSHRRIRKFVIIKYVE